MDRADFDNLGTGFRIMWLYSDGNSFIHHPLFIGCDGSRLLSRSHVIHDILVPRKRPG